MVWIFLGSLTPLEKEWQTLPFQFPSDLNLLKFSYSSIYQEIDDGYGWIRTFYPSFNFYSSRWRKFYPKNQEQEIVYLFEELFYPDSEKFIQVKKSLYPSYRGVKRADLSWSVSVEVWDTPIYQKSVTNFEEINLQIESVENELANINNTLNNLSIINEEINQINEINSQILTFITGGI